MNNTPIIKAILEEIPQADPNDLCIEEHKDFDPEMQHIDTNLKSGNHVYISHHEISLYLEGGDEPLSWELTSINGVRYFWLSI